MDYSPKLKTAMSEIKGILSRYDLGAVIVIHEGHHSEFVVKIDPTYSCAKIVNGGVRLKAKLQEDFNGDKVKMQKVLTDTSNMLMHLGIKTGELSIQLLEASELMDKHVQAEHTKGKNTSHEQQNN